MTQESFNYQVLQWDNVTVAHIIRLIYNGRTTEWETSAERDVVVGGSDFNRLQEGRLTSIRPKGARWLAIPQPLEKPCRRDKGNWIPPRGIDWLMGVLAFKIIVRCQIPRWWVFEWDLSWKFRSGWMACQKAQNWTAKQTHLLRSESKRFPYLVYFWCLSAALQAHPA